METIPSWLWWWSPLCGIIGSVIGSKKGRLTVGFILGFLAGPIGIGITLLLKGNREPCPFCLERIHKDASVCPCCHTELPAGYGEIKSGNGWAVKLAFVLVGLIIIAGIGWGFVGYNLSPVPKSFTASSIGDVRHIKAAKSGRLLLFRDRNSLEEFINAAASNNEGTAYVVGLSANAVSLPDQTQVVVIDTALSRTSPSLNLVQVRILEGKYYGSTGWAHTDDLRRGSAQTYLSHKENEPSGKC